MKLIFRFFSNQAIGIKEKNAYALKGKFKRSMLSDISSICESFGIEKGEIWISQSGSINFSGEIKEENHQRFRNAIHFNR